MVVHMAYADLVSLVLLYIVHETSLLVGYNVRVIVELQGSNVTGITCGEFLVELDFLPSLLCPTSACQSVPEASPTVPEGLSPPGIPS
jgi:hypothetical protein